MKSLVPILCVVLAACGAGPEVRPQTELVAGDLDGPPAMEALPTADVQLSEMSQHMRDGFELAEAAFEIPEVPLPPQDGPGFSAWAEGTLRNWVQQKHETVRSAQSELDLAADQNLRERIIAGGIVGLLYEDIGTELMRVPIPPTLQSDPEIAEVFREVMVGEAAPYLEHSRAAYRACARNADGGPETLRHWRSFCAGRRVNLPEE